MEIFNLGTQLQDLAHEQKKKEYHFTDLGNAERLVDWAAGESRLVGFPAGDHNTILSLNGIKILQEVGLFVKASMNS